MEPDRLGPYRIEALLGRGETGAVFRALDTEHDRVVALAVLSEALSADPGYREQFHREAGLAAALAEPHAVPVHRSTEAEGRLLLETALVPGRDLAAVLAEEGPLDPARAVAVVGQAARAVDAAAVAGLHRGVVPADVLLTGSGADERVQVTLVPPPPGAPSGEGVAVPALAGLLAACLTGRTTPPGGTPEPPSRLHAGLPPGFDEVVRRGLTGDPRERYRTGGELAAAAAAVLPAPGDATAGPSRRADGEGRDGRLPVVLAGVAAVAVLAVLALVLVTVLNGGTDDSAGAATAAPRTTVLTTTPSAPPEDAAEDQLRAIIPGDFINVDCDPGEPTDDGALAVLGCGSSSNQPGAEDSMFYLYADARTAEAVFLADMERNGVAPLPADARCPQVQGHGSYSIRNERAGRLACYIDEDNNAILAWTQDDVAAEGLAVIINGGQPGLGALYDWWAEAESSEFVPR